MKNNLIITLGLVVAFGSAAGLVSASRDAYHNYQYQSGFYARNYGAENPENLAIRVTTDRITSVRPQNRIVETQSQTTQSNTVERTAQRNYRGSRAQADWANEKDLVERVGVSRPFAERTGKWQTVASARSVVSFNNIPDVGFGTTFEGETFVVSVPDQFEVQSGAELLTAVSGDMTIKVQKIDNVCGESGFFACGVGLSKNMNGYGAAELQTSSRVDRESVTAYKYLSSNDMTPTFSESFEGVRNGEELFVTRYFVADKEGNLIYTIEAVAPIKDGAKLVASAKEVFSSFHIK